MSYPTREIEQLVFPDHNVNEMNSEEFECLKESIREHGFVSPILVNSLTGNVVGGSHRVRAAKVLGLKEVPVFEVQWPLEKEKMVSLALNRIHGHDNEEKLAVLLRELTQLPEFKPASIGFDVPEISRVLDAHLVSPDGDAFDAANDLETHHKIVTEKGERIVLENHVLMNGDSACEADVAKLFGSEKINLVFTDPPYSVGYYSMARPHGKHRPKKCKNWGLVYQDDLSQEDYEKMLSGVFLNMNKYLAPGSAFYIFNGHAQFGPMHHMLTKLDYHISCVIVWSKPNFSISFGDYHQQVEFALYGWKEDNGAHYWAGPTNESTLWQCGRDAAKKLVHATQKPIALAQRAIRNSSKRGDVVADFFGGSGSTLIASETLGRRCFAMEYEQRHCDSIVRRYLAYVGKTKASPELWDRYMKEVPDGQ